MDSQPAFGKTELGCGAGLEQPHGTGLGWSKAGGWLTGFVAV